MSWSARCTTNAAACSARSTRGAGVPNLDEAGRRTVDAWRDAAKLSFDASDKAKPEDKAQHAIALACHRAIATVRAAAERCGNGPPARPN